MSLPQVPTSIDPLIAEANRRMRRRQAAIAAALTITALAVGVTIALRSPPSPHEAGLAPNWSSLPTLRGAAAFVALVAIDRRSDVAEFRVSCGVFTKYSDREGFIPKRKLALARVHPGLYRVALRGGTFNVSSYAETASGAIPSHANEVTLKAWERGVHIGWAASLWVGSAGPNLSDGPSTDICHGVLG